jgi:hypothetical protein
MAKEIKGNPRRKPPEPSAEHADIDEWFGGLMPYLQPIVKAVDELIRATLPDLQYGVKYKRAFYGLPEQGWIIEIASYDVSMNVLFLGGVDFNSPPALGTGRTRFVKITNLDAVEGAELQNWIEQAADTPGWK